MRSFAQIILISVKIPLILVISFDLYKDTVSTDSSEDLSTAENESV